MPRIKDENLLDRLYATTQRDDLAAVSGADPLTIESWHAIRQARAKPEEERFDFVLRTLPERLLDGLIDVTRPRSSVCAQPASSALLLLLLFVRRDIHGDQGNGFFTGVDPLRGLAGSESVLHPYFVLELIRRLCRTASFKLPADPYSYIATVHIQGLYPGDIEAAQQELKRRGLESPLPPLSARPQRKREGVIEINIAMPMFGGSSRVYLEFDIPPQEAPPLDPAAFVAAIRGIIERAHNLDESILTPLLDLHQMNGAAGFHIAAVLREHFGDDWAQHQSAMLRLHALMQLLDQEQLDPWFCYTPGGYGVHPAVLQTAASMRLSVSGEFWHDLFEEEVHHHVQRGHVL